MFQALFTVILTTWIASASASSTPPAVPAPATMTPTGAAPKATRMKLQSGTESVKVNTALSADKVSNGQAGSGSTAAGQTETNESGWRSYGTLLATLVLMGVIAVRRHKTGKS